MATDTAQHTGDCFWAALRTAKQYEGVEVLVCHGKPIGRGEANLGVRYWHAWNEARHGNGWIVIDGANANGERPVVLKRGVYYKWGQPVGTTVRRYTVQEAREWMRKLNHMGPWEDFDGGI